MTFNLLFNTVIYVIIIFLIIFVIKVYRHTIRLHVIGKEKQATLEANFKKQKVKSQIMNGHILMADNLERTLFYRLFEISKELIRLQKLSLNSN